MIPAIPESITQEEFAVLDEPVRSSSPRISPRAERMPRMGEGMLSGFQYSVVAAVRNLTKRGEDAKGISILNWVEEKWLITK